MTNAASSRSWLRWFAAAFAALPLLLGSAVWTAGDAANSPALKLISIIPINGTAGSPGNKLFSFDISFVDPANGLFYLADRSNKSLDVIDTTGAFTSGKADSLFGQIGGSNAGQANFTGFTPCVPAAGANDCAGPDGVAAAFPCIFAGDGNSTLKSFNANASFSTVVSTMATGGTTRVDEMALDVADGLIIAVNNAETPPFATIFSYSKTSCVLSNPVKVIIDNLPVPAGGTVTAPVAATNGAEQPAFDPVSGAFYISIPEINGPGGGGPNGAVIKVSKTGVIQATFQINFCQPAGLTTGPNGDLLVGCNTVFDLSGKACNSVQSIAAAAGTTRLTERPASCTGVAFPQSAICNPSKGCTGSSLVSVPGVGGGDEVWFNSGDGNYYVTAGNNPNGPTLGVIQSGTNVLTQLVPTIVPQAAVSGTAPVGTVHSVAASAGNNHVYVPLPANNYLVDSKGNNCVNGCVAVFSAQ
jgi:hypothetical protein